MTMRSKRWLIAVVTGAITLVTVLFILNRPGNYLIVENLIFVLLFTLLNSSAAVKTWQLSEVQHCTLAKNEVFRHGFSLWFGIGVVIFVAANFIGVSPGKMRFLGLPATVTPSFGHDGCALLAFGLDVGFALGHAYLLGLGMAYERYENLSADRK